MFVYESVPGTSVFHLEQDGSVMSFHVEGPEDAQITVEMEPDTEYRIFIDGFDTGKVKTNLGGKLSFMNSYCFIYAVFYGRAFCKTAVGVRNGR